MVLLPRRNVTSKEKCYFKYVELLESGMRINLAPNKCFPGLTPPFLHTVSDQKLDGKKVSPLSLLGRSGNKARKADVITTESQRQG